MFDNMKIILADDHPLFRQALTITLKSHFSGAEIFDAQTIPELEQHLQSVNDADLLLLDLDKFLNFDELHSLSSLSNIADNETEITN